MASTTAELNNRPVDPEVMLPDLFKQHPQVRSVFDAYGLRGCGGPLGPMETVRFFARTHGVDESKLIHEITEAIEHPIAQKMAPPDPADSIYRRYFLGGIAVIISAGATWGAWLLWQIGISGRFTGASVQAINAHGHAQIYGWVGLFIMGFSLQAFPRLWHTSLWHSKCAMAAFYLMIFGLIARSTGMIFSSDSTIAPAIALMGGLLELVSVAIYITVILQTYLRSAAASRWKREPYVAFAISSLFYFLVSTIVCVWHMWQTMTAATPEALTFQVATYQAPLRDLQIHGLALLMILGVCLRMLPALYEVVEVSVKRSWIALTLINAAIAGEIVFFLLYRWTNNHFYAIGLTVSWVLLPAGVLTVVLPWRPWKNFPVTDRSEKFIRAAYGWLAISLLMLLALPVYLHATGLEFSHAYYGATRHAITVGFISLMIMGFAAKVVPTLNGVDPKQLTPLWGPFLLVNIGCLLRVTLQTATDFDSRAFNLVGISGVLEVTGLAWWGMGLVKILFLNANEVYAPTSPRPCRLAGSNIVADVLFWYPQTLALLVTWGYTPLNNPVLRRTLTRHVTLSQAARLKGINETELLEALNKHIGCSTENCNHQG